jgi:hypothetical protein
LSPISRNANCFPPPRRSGSAVPSSDS